jgi:hypothetical protein
MIHKIFDLTFLTQKKDVMYLSYPNAYHIIKDPSLASELFSKHRGMSTPLLNEDSTFKGNTSMYKLLQLLRFIYPNINFVTNDFMLTCDERYTKLYHNFIKNQFDENYQKYIQKNITKIFSDLEGDICINDLIDNYTMNNLGYIFNDDNFEFDKEIGKHCSIIHKFIYDNIDKTKIELETFKKGPIESFEKLRNTIQYFLDKKSNKLDEFSKDRKISMIFLFILFGQEKMASFLKYAIYLLSKEKNIDKNYTDEIINHIYTKSLVESSPFYALGRFFRKDTIIGGQFFHGNDIVALYPSLLYKKSNDNYINFIPFGTGAHICPGKKIVFMQVKELLTFLISNYKITSKENKIDFSLQLIRKIESDIVINFQKDIY